MKKIITLFLCALLVFSAFSLTGCRREFTNEEHIERISQRVRERFFNEESEYAELYTDFTVTILYNANDEPTFFMVEFEPDGFFYGIIFRNNYYFNWANFYWGSQWTLGDMSIIGTGQGGWGGSTEQNYRSHFYVAGITSERKYLSINFKRGHLYPAVYRDEVFICLTFDGEIPMFSDIPTGINSLRRGIRL